MSSNLPLQPGKVASECLCLGLRRAARALSRRYDEALVPLDLNNGQFSMLTVIAGLQPVGMQALAERLAMDRTTVTAALKPLQRRGLVTVEASDQDLRARQARLAPAGTTLLSKAIPLWQSVQDAVAAELTPAATTQLREQLVRLG
jgi:DNA-binding MarR family transcriptional regulator